MEPSARSDLASLLATAKERHADADDDGHHWADWYGDYLASRLTRYGIDAGPDTLATWLTEAERAHQRDAPDTPWPEFYARYLLRAARPGDA